MPSQAFDSLTVFRVIIELRNDLGALLHLLVPHLVEERIVQALKDGGSKERVKFQHRFKHVQRVLRYSREALLKVNFLHRLKLFNKAHSHVV